MEHTDPFVTAWRAAARFGRTLKSFDDWLATCRETWTDEDWRYDVRNSDTRLGYDDWLLRQMESAEDSEVQADGTDCGAVFNQAGDGWNGECPDCADKTAARTPTH